MVVWSSVMTDAEGTELPLDGVLVARVQDGRIVDASSYYDTCSYLAPNEISASALIYPHWHQARTAADRFGAADRALHSPARPAPTSG